MTRINQEKKYAKYKKIRKRKSFFKARIFWRALGVIIIVFELIYLFIFSPAFRIKNIKTDGEVRYLDINAFQNEIAAMVGKKSPLNFSSNIFFFKKNSAIENLLDKFPPLKEIKIKKNLPGGISFIVLERSPVANYCLKEECFLVDDGGYLFATSENDLVLLKTEKNEAVIGQTIIEKNLWIKAQLIIKALENNLFIKIKLINVSSEKIEVTTDQNWLLVFSPQKSIDWQIQQLGLILEKQIPSDKKHQIEYIDLRFEKIFYKIK